MPIVWAARSPPLRALPSFALALRRRPKSCLQFRLTYSTTASFECCPPRTPSPCLGDTTSPGYTTPTTLAARRPAPHTSAALQKLLASHDLRYPASVTQPAAPAIPRAPARPPQLYHHHCWTGYYGSSRCSMTYSFIAYFPLPL
ncbi:hypothetical protein K523DRAFT_323498 [Schizophyllum commune Tattone D]|nr:hypothetical protein K523DRAFT_323498 [Schizophyllum commune Tattone D]